NVPFAGKFDLNAGSGPYGLAVGDLDGDGKPDLVVANSNSDTISVYRNGSVGGTLESGSFPSKVDFSTGSLPTKVLIWDVDWEGRPDLLVINGEGNSFSVFRNTAVSGALDGNSFVASPSIPTPGKPGGLAFGDIDGDGKPDVLVGIMQGGGLGVFRNTS